MVNFTPSRKEPPIHIEQKLGSLTQRKFTCLQPTVGTVLNTLSLLASVSWGTHFQE